MTQFRLPHRFAGNLGFQQATRSDQARISDQVIANTRVSGELEVARVGEAAIDVTFPVWFTQKPAFSFGGELVENEYMQEGKFPTVSVVVISWERKLDARNDGGYYVGARLAVVTMGRDPDAAGHGQRMLVHWQMEGKAMQNPVRPSGPM